MILMYHNIVPDNAPSGLKSTCLTLSLASFKRQINWLAAHFQILPMKEYLDGLQKSGKKEDRAIAITFDDGLAITFQCACPVLKEWSVPATFFVTTRHIEHGELMWGSYLNALCLEKIYAVVKVGGQDFSLRTFPERRHAQLKLYTLARETNDPVDFSCNLAKSYPLPESVVVYYQGVSYEQLRAAGKSDFIEIGSHAVTHSDLDRQPKALQQREIFDSKRILEELTDKRVRYLAYPSGNYNQDTLELVKAAGYEATFATIPQNLGDDPRFELERVGIYSPSLLKLHLKALGLAGLLRHMGVHVG